jgi:hypothetical protein
VKPLSQQNLYEILDVPFDASQAVIAEAVERAQALYAPGSLATYTLMEPDEEHLLLSLLEEARSTLLDPAARARYDERITGPYQAAAPPASPAATPGMDAVIRAAWPELPPVIPAMRAPVEEEEWEDEGQPAQAGAEASPGAVAAAPAERPAPAQVVAEPAPPKAPPRPPPILLDREVSAPPAASPAPAAPVVPPPAQPEAPALTESAIWSGEVLRKIREGRGLSLPQISERTKVTRHHIENIERDRFEALPATVYLRGILLSLARELRLDGQKVARSYLERVAAARAGASPQRPR